MALTTSSSTSKTQIRSSLSRWTGSIDAADRPLFCQFVDETLNRLRGPFLAHHPPNSVLAYLEAAFRFAQHRPPGQTRVGIERQPTKGIAIRVNMNDQPFIVDTIRLFLQEQPAPSTGAASTSSSASERDDDR